MAAVVGTTGSVTITGDLAGVSLVAMTIVRWSGSISQGSVDTTGFLPTKNARTTIGNGLPGMTGTFEGLLDDTNTIDELGFEDDTPVIGVFTLVSSDIGEGKSIEYGFSGWVTGISPSVRVGEVNKFTASFKSSGTITSSAES